jgi:hypothetical protein
MVEHQRKKHFMDVAQTEVMGMSTQAIGQ